MIKKHKIMISIIAIILVTVIGVVLYFFNAIQAVSSNNQEVVVAVSGSANNVLNQLDEAGLIKDKTIAKLYLRLNHYDFIANTYILNTNMDLATICEILEGDQNYISMAKVTIVEGYRITECADKVAEALEVSSSDVLAKWSDSEYLNTLIEKYWFLDQSILSSEIMFPLEGYFAPETYIITASSSSIEDVTEMMLDQMAINLKQYRDDIEGFMINGSNVTMHQFLTLASIVQCESNSNQDDQQKIAGVFMQRLAISMPLQSDVTVNYANQVKTVAVTYRDLSVDSKYNTYLYYGLPVGPISNVCNDIIESCLNYQNTGALFFFATQDGTVLYSNTLQEHEQVVATHRWY